MKQIVQQVAKLARLQLTEQEIEEFAKDMESITQAFAMLEQAPTPRNLENASELKLREDKVEQSLTQQEALQLAALKEKGFIVGPQTK